MQRDWLILAPEFPPKLGGVGDYTALVAEGLATLGDDVHVFAPAPTAPWPETRVRLHDCRFDRAGRTILDAALRAAEHPVILLQYVPLVFGRTNIAFFVWLCSRREPLWVMFHEVAYPLVRGQRFKHRALAVVTRWIAAALLRHAERVFVSTPAWTPTVIELAPCARAPIWLPVPSNLPVTHDERGATTIRQELGLVDVPVVGHFGTYGALVTPTLLRVLVEVLEREPRVHCLLVGRRSEDFAARLRQGTGPASDRVRCISEGTSERMAQALGVADVMVFPFPDGVSTRRGSVMAALAQGRPVVTTVGEATEPLWAECGCVELSGRGPHELAERVIGLLGDRHRRELLAARAGVTYVERFSVERTVATLSEVRSQEDSSYSA